MSAHTPGPWEVDADGDVIAFGSDTRTTVAILLSNEEHDANLIAAAPDLLEALERLSLQMQNLLLVAEVPKRFAQSFNEAQSQADAAIAKARGGYDN